MMSRCKPIVSLFFCACLSSFVVWSDPVKEAVSKPGRIQTDLKRDKRSRPQDIIPFLNLKPGDRVVDIFGSGGYYSELLASMVGEQGEVLLHNNRGFRAWGINILNDRFTARDIGNITPTIRRTC